MHNEKLTWVFLLVSWCLLFSASGASEPDSVLLPEKRLIPGDGGFRLTGLVSGHDGGLMLRAASRGERYWYRYHFADNRLVEIEEACGLSARIVVDVAFVGKESYLLCKDPISKQYRIVTCELEAKSQRNSRGLREVPLLKVDYPATRLFVDIDLRSFVLGTPAEMRKGRRYHFHRFSMDGTFLGSFAPTISLPDTIPFFSLYYFASVIGHPRHGYVVSYWNVPEVYIFDVFGRIKHEYKLQNVPESESTYSLDPRVNFGMAIPKRRLLGAPAFDEAGRLWLPVMNGRNTEIRVLADGAELRKYRLANELVFMLRFGDGDPQPLFALTKEALLVFQLRRKRKW